MEKKCIVCKNTFFKKPTVSKKKWETMKFCSHSCVGKYHQNGKDSRFQKGHEYGNRFKEGHTPWNKDKEGVMPEPWNKGKKIPELQNENHHNWKGDSAHIKTKHGWVKSRLGLGEQCGWCLNTSEYATIDWANIDHTYRRNLDDWMQMCRSCHRYYDIAFNDYRK